MNVKVSVILPVYKVEKYISSCIYSLSKQSFKDFEIILVNDGTPDKSIEIAEDILANSNIRYTIINQENKGVSAARNEGIKNANGEWIICIDSDDVIDEACLKILYDSTLQKNIDISIGNFQNVSEENIYKKYNTLYSNEIIYKKDILRLFLTRKIKIISPAILMRKEFIIENDLFYNEEIRFSEDQYFIWKLLFNINKCSYNKTAIYNYLTRENSTMTSSGIEKIMTGYYGFEKLSKNINNSACEDIGKFIFPRWILGSLRASSKILSYNDFKTLADRMDYKKNTKNLVSFPSFKTMLMYIIMITNLKLFYHINKKI